MANMNDKTAFQIGVDAVSKIAHPRRHSQVVGEAISTSRCFLDEFSSRISRAQALADAESKKALTKLLDDIRFSDPVSAEEAHQEECDLIAIADGFLRTIENGETVAEQDVDRARALLKARNGISKSAK